MSVTLPIAPGAKRGFGPQWWRSGTRTPLWWVGLAVFLLVTLGACYASLHVGERPGLVIVATAEQFVEAAVGLLFWMWRPGNPVGPLLLIWVTVVNFSDPNAIPESHLAWTVYFLF